MVFTLISKQATTQNFAKREDNQPKKSLLVARYIFFRYLLFFGQTHRLGYESVVYLFLKIHVVTIGRNVLCVWRGNNTIFRREHFVIVIILGCSTESSSYCFSKLFRSNWWNGTKNSFHFVKVLLKLCLMDPCNFEKHLQLLVTPPGKLQLKHLIFDSQPIFMFGNLLN